ncbi:MAG TPA: hypothetical protein VMJ66_15850, partial [Geobacteraceae bacterium]|nr:hypothetical protein [Geobacteraceae bacterium]
MQSCIVDGRAMDIKLSGADCLAGVLESVNGELAKNGRFIAALRVNGREVADLAGESSRPLDGIQSIEITTDSPVRLARDIAAEGRTYIEGLQGCLLRAAGRFTSGSESAGRDFEEAVQGMQWLVQMIGFVEQNLNLDFMKLSLNGRPVAAYVQSLNAIFLDIVNSQERSDPVL